MDMHVVIESAMNKFKSSLKDASWKLHYVYLDNPDL
jgi:hypothetical protein